MLTCMIFCEGRIYRRAKPGEAAGVLAVIIANNQPSATLIGLGGSAIVGITSVTVTLSGGQMLRQFPDTTVNIVVASSSGALAGTDAARRLKMYAPPSIE